MVPAQVLLQVLVVEVSLTESTQFGLELSGQTRIGGKNSLIGTNYANLTTPSTTTTTDSQGNVSRNVSKQDGFTYFLSDPDNPDNKFAYIRALAGNGNIKVVSSPQLLVSSHTEATINVGSKVSVRTQSLVNSNSGDGNITWELITERINSDLANTYGNLVSRTAAMSLKYFGGEICDKKADEPVDAGQFHTCGASI